MQILSVLLYKTKINKLNNIFSKITFLVTPFLCCTFILFLLTILSCNWKQVLESSVFNIDNSYLIKLIINIAIIIISLLLHEVGHAVVAVKYGLSVNELAISLYMYVNPMVYLKIPGMYTVKPKKRIHIWLAGVIVNLFIMSFSLLIYTMVSDKNILEVIKYTLFSMSYINFILIICNLLPFMMLDGYFILSTILKIPNLRRDAFKNIKYMLNNRKKNGLIYIIYFILSSIVMTFIMGREIFIMASKFIREYLNSFSLIMALWSIKVYLVLFIIVVYVTVLKKIKLGKMNK